MNTVYELVVDESVFVAVAADTAVVGTAVLDRVALDRLAAEHTHHSKSFRSISDE